MEETGVTAERRQIRRPPDVGLGTGGGGDTKQSYEDEGSRPSNQPHSCSVCRNRPGVPVSGAFSPFATIAGFVRDTDKTGKTKQSVDQVSELTTNRLSVYLRCLNQLEGAGVKTISSQALAEQFHLNAAQIRKDLAYFGEFGVRGVGYYVRDLKRHLRQILGLDRKLRVAIIGAGNLGLALADYQGFQQEGFEIGALFDNQPSKVGRKSKGGIPIEDIADLKKLARRDAIRIAVIAVPAASAQRVVEMVVASGIKAILNFSPGSLQVPPDVKLKSVDLTVSLESLSFYLARGEE